MFKEKDKNADTERLMLDDCARSPWKTVVIFIYSNSTYNLKENSLNNFRNQKGQESSLSQPALIVL